MTSLNLYKFTELLSYLTYVKFLTSFKFEHIHSTQTALAPRAKPEPRMIEV